jgi:serine/threonine-protein kinase
MSELAQVYGPGTVIGGKYRIDVVLGRGNMGLVVAAWDVAMERRVAVKLMLPGKIAEEQQERFLREARTAAKLKSEHAVAVLDVSTDGGSPYLVMEYLDGRDLAAELQARGPLPIEEAVEHMLQASEALAEAHAAGIVHRDVKPANLFLTRAAGGRPIVKVVDFGIARLAKESALTLENMAIGSPLYMAPEQMRDARSVDARADIWAMGVTLYELLTARTPFPGDDLTSVATRAHLEPPVPIAEHRTDVPRPLWSVIEQCLAKQRSQRWPSCAELAAALAPFGPARAAVYVERVAAVAGVQVVPSRPTEVLVLPPPTPPAKTVAATGTGGAVVRPTQPPGAPPGRRGVLVAVAVALLGGTLAGGGYVAFRELRHAQPAATAAPSTVAPPVESVTVAPAPAGPDAAVPTAADAAPDAAVAPVDAGPEPAVTAREIAPVSQPVKTRATPARPVQPAQPVQPAATATAKTKPRGSILDE